MLLRVFQTFTEYVSYLWPEDISGWTHGSQTKLSMCRYEVMANT